MRSNDRELGPIRRYDRAGIGHIAVVSRETGARGGASGMTRIVTDRLRRQAWLQRPPVSVGLSIRMRKSDELERQAVACGRRIGPMADHEDPLR